MGKNIPQQQRLHVLAKQYNASKGANTFYQFSKECMAVKPKFSMLACILQQQ
jgi:hypothetical protein